MLDFVTPYVYTPNLILNLGDQGGADVGLLLDSPQQRGK